MIRIIVECSVRSTMGIDHDQIAAELGITRRCVDAAVKMLRDHQAQH